MRFDPRFWRLSPQEVDPLSWFTGPYVPTVFAVINLVYGTLSAVADAVSGASPILQGFGVALSTLACLLVQFLTRPMSGPLGWGAGAAVVAISIVGFAVAAVGYTGSALPLELWWGPFGVALTIGALGPYLPARALAVLGAAATLVSVPLASIAVQFDDHPWGPLGRAFVLAAPIVSATVAFTVFSVAVVGRMVPLIERRSQTIVAVPPIPELRYEEAERARLARLIERAAPFIEHLARSGEVTPTDRTLAGQLARQLRDDLVRQSDSTWLDAIATERLVVVDPERSAARMRSSQRTALRALLRALLDLPGADAGSVLVELRRLDDRSVAVGVSLDVDLPEGRRILHLAPAYLALRGSVDDLRVSAERELRVTFHLPEDDDAAGSR